MYRFTATYINMDTGDSRCKEIYFDGQFFQNEKECYMHAMSTAYDNAAQNECFANIEFISC